MKTSKFKNDYIFLTIFVIMSYIKNFTFCKKRFFENFIFKLLNAH